MPATAEPTIPLLISSKEFSALIGCDARTPETWRYRTSRYGRPVGPPWITIGNTVRYDIAEVQKWISENKRGQLRGDDTTYYDPTTDTFHTENGNE